MTSQSPGSDLPSTSELRRSLMAGGDARGGELDRWQPAEPSHFVDTRARPAAPRHPLRQSSAAASIPVPPPSPARGAALPSADEVLSASPAVVRLCESYHRSLATMVQRSRRQRIGIFCLVAALSVGATLLSRSGTLTAELVSDVVLAAAGSSGASLVLLALLWMRDQRQLRTIQGQRLLRAIQSNSSLPPERLNALRSQREPVATFFDCYSVWRAQHREPQNRLAALIATFRGTNHPTAA